MLKFALEQVAVGRGHMSANDHGFDLEEVMAVEGEVIVYKDKLCDLGKELSGL